MNREASEAREVSPGYGLKTDPSTLKVPKEWIRCELSDVLTLQRGYDLPHRHRRAGDYPIISSSGVSGTHQVPKVEGPGVVTGRYGTIGEIFYVSGSYWPLNTTLYVRSFKGNDPKYVSYLLQRVDFISHSGKSGVPGVNRNDVHKEQVNLPPLPEQRAITTALSDVDALLKELDSLIAKKRDIKQATMQQLLTGQTRLPGFEGEWVTKPLSQLADIRSGGTPSTSNSSFWSGEIPWCTPTDITALCGGKYLTSTDRCISPAGLQASSAEIIPTNSVIMTTRATIGECAINTIPMTTNQGFKNLVPQSVDGEFLYYLMTTYKNRLVQLCAGSTFLEIGKKQLDKFELYLPENLDEQEAISATLSDMDNELVAIEKRRAKTAALKQAMMQSLLTGRIRLI